MKTDRTENVKFIATTNFKDRLHHILQLLIGICFLLDYLLFLRFLFFRDYVSLLTTCSMSKTLLECFLLYCEHVFVYAFAVTTSFSMSILNKFQTLIYFYLLSILYCVPKKPPEVPFKKGVL